jgi:hypothetical protein
MILANSAIATPGNTTKSGSSMDMTHRTSPVSFEYFQCLLTRFVANRLCQREEDSGHVEVLSDPEQVGEFVVQPERRRVSRCPAPR